KIILLSLIATYTSAQHYFDKVIATNQNNISTIDHPAIEIKDSVFCFIRNEYRNYYGFSESLLRMDQEGKVISSDLYLDTLNPYWILDANYVGNKILTCGVKQLKDEGKRIIMYGTLNANMDTVWTKTITSQNNYPGVYKITRLNNGNIAIVGEDTHIRPTGGAYFENNGAILILADSIGNILKYIHFPKRDTNSLEGLNYVIQVRSGDIYCVGTVKNGTSYFKGLIIKLNKDGDFIWRKEIEKSAYGYYLRYCKELLNGNIQIVGAKYRPFFLNDAQVWLSSIEMDSSGKLVSEKNIFNEHLTYYYYCTEDKYGNIVCASAVAHDDTSSAKGYLIKLSSTGDSIWKREFTRGWKDRDEVFLNIANAEDGGYYLTGYNWVSGDNSSKAWVVKVDSNGCVVPGCNTAVNVEKEYYKNLFHLFPNPVDDYLIIYLNDEDLQDRRYMLRCFDQNGKLVLTQEIGGRKTNVEVGSLPSGMYFYQIGDGRKLIQSGKLVKM
ncbi:MAG TPA: T9SS type A sorting domain-containing protein, partial [Saprospiraceae bacterium]|nr:T9SS type A sorting domain-containing protein [Saprospiraceae bacterium]